MWSALPKRLALSTSKRFTRINGKPYADLLGLIFKVAPRMDAMLATKSYLFRDKLKTPGYLSQFDVARIRLAITETTDEEFKEFLSCDKSIALQILEFWEVAQVELWDVEILKRFFFLMIYEDRDLVTARIKAAQKTGRLTEYVTPEDGLQWLKSENVLMGMAAQWIQANFRPRTDGALTTSCESSVAADTTPDPDRHDDRALLLASREQLIAAFGSFTGMTADWFENLRDTPRLLAARKVSGQGGRGGAEPFFCPFMVMQWLVDPARKKGRSLSVFKGWQLFEGHFPAAYDNSSMCDPRIPDSPG